MSVSFLCRSAWAFGLPSSPVREGAPTYPGSECSNSGSFRLVPLRQVWNAMNRESIAKARSEVVDFTLRIPRRLRPVWNLGFQPVDRVLMRRVIEEVRHFERVGLQVV